METNALMRNANEQVANVVVRQLSAKNPYLAISGVNPMAQTVGKESIDISNSLISTDATDSIKLILLIPIIFLPM